jgi:hypothetical protein
MTTFAAVAFVILVAVVVAFQIALMFGEVTLGGRWCGKLPPHA